MFFAFELDLGLCDGSLFATKYAQNPLVGAIVLRKGHILAIELYLCKCGFVDESLRLFVIEYVANNVQTKP